MRKLSSRRFVSILLVSLLVSGLVTGASTLGYLDSIQQKALDFFIWWKGEGRMAEIVIVAIDEDAFAQMGNRQPLPRESLAELLNFLTACGPRALGLDIEIKAATKEKADRALLNALSSGIVVPFDVAGIRDSDRVSVSKLLHHDALPRKGFANTILDSDGVVRSVPLRLEDEDGRQIEAFGMQLYRIVHPEVKNYPGRIRIDYAGPAGTFPTFSAAPLLQLAAQKIVPPGDNPFRDKIVLVGGTFRASRDFVLTPKGVMSGVEAQANILNTLLTDSHIRTPHWILNFALQVLLSVLFGLLFFLFRYRTALILSFSLIILVVIPASYHLYLSYHYWIDFLIPILAVKLTGTMIDRSERRRVRSEFSSYVSKEIMQCVYDNAALLNGQRTEVTVFFADIRGFTTLSEPLPPEQLSAFLNEYYAFMTSAVVRHGGVVNKFIGDAVMAVYGVPVRCDNHAKAAVATAQTILDGLGPLSAQLQERGLPALAIGIGIHSGPVFAGNIGTAERKEYAVVGDTVNIASRLEGMNKQFGTTCLITESTLQALHDCPPTQDMGEIAIRGRRQSLRVYALFQKQEEPPCIHES